MNNNNINLSEQDIKKINNIVLIFIFFILPIVVPLFLTMLFFTIITIPFISTKLFALPFVFVSFALILLIGVINLFRKKEQKINILIFIGFFFVSLVFSIFQISKIKIDKVNKMDVETETIERILYMDPYKKVFDEDDQFGNIKYIVNEDMEEYQFIIRAKTPKELKLKEYMYIDFDDDQELDFVEKQPYNEFLFIKYYYNTFKKGLKDGKIYLKNFYETSDEVSIEANSETIELIKSKVA